MKNKNPYESLKIDSLPNAAPVDAQSALRVTKADDEQIIIWTAVLASGQWTYGYRVQWHSNRVSAKSPSGENGLFKTQRDAQLYAIGFMKSFLEYFTPESAAALINAEFSLLQNNLFFD